MSMRSSIYVPELPSKLTSRKHAHAPELQTTVSAVRLSLQALLLGLPAGLLLGSHLSIGGAVLASVLLPIVLPLQRSMGRAAAASEEKSTATYLVLKRVVDLSVSSTLLLLLSPALFGIAVAVFASSAGSPLFVQERVGKNGVPFRMYKFRSMYADAALYAHSPRSSRDPRITRVGRWLRRASLDELPQLFNVLRGDMSLVGPRPEMPFIVQSYSAEQQLRLRVQPGLTGLWQLSRDRLEPIHENLHHDLLYIRERSLSLDLAILIHTLLFAMGGGV